LKLLHRWLGLMVFSVRVFLEFQKKTNISELTAWGFAGRSVSLCFGNCFSDGLRPESGGGTRMSREVAEFLYIFFII